MLAVVVSMPQMVATSTMDPESVGLVRDYVNELMAYVPASPFLPMRLISHTQMDAHRARAHICQGVRISVHTVPEHIAVIRLIILSRFVVYLCCCRIAVYFVPSVPLSWLYHVDYVRCLVTAQISITT